MSVFLASFFFLALVCLLHLEPSTSLTMVRDDRVFVYVGPDNNTQIDNVTDLETQITNYNEPDFNNYSVINSLSDTPSSSKKSRDHDSINSLASSDSSRIASDSAFPGHQNDETPNDINVIFNDGKRDPINDHERDPLTVAHVPEAVQIRLKQILSDPSKFLEQFVDFGQDGDQDAVESSKNDDELQVSSLMRGSARDTDEAGSSRTSDRRKTTAKIPRITSPAGCAIEMRTIEIKDPNEDSDLYYPWCVRLPRCSGCCPSTRLKCVPTNSSMVDIVAVKLHYANFNQRFKYEGVRIFKMEQHESCRCECIQQASDCNARQVYRPEECRCVCLDPTLADECQRQDKIWIPDTCSCHCKFKHTCMTGTVFNHDTCKCEIERHLMDAAIQMDEKQASNFLRPLLRPLVDSELKKQERRRLKASGYNGGINPDAHGLFKPNRHFPG